MDVKENKSTLERLSGYMTDMGFIEVQRKEGEKALLGAAAALSQDRVKKLFFKKLAGKEMDREAFELFIEALFSSLDEDTVVEIMESGADCRRKRNALEIAIYKAEIEGGMKNE